MINLTKGEKDCFRRLQLLESNILNMNIQEIADTVHYSPATINRLIKKLGYDNIKAYKRNLFFSTNIANADDYYNILHNIINTNYDTSFKFILECLKQATRIHVVGLDASNSVAISLFRGLSMNGYESDLYSSGGIFNAYASENATDGDVIFICSYSCSDYYLCNAVEIIYNSAINTKVILITSKDDNPISKYCDITISSKSYDYDNIYRVIAPISIILHKFLKYLEIETRNPNINK